VAELAADVEAAKRILKQMHPGLYLYTSQQELDAAFAQIAASLEKPLTASEFLVSLAPAVEMIRCGHTYLMPTGRQQDSLEHRGRLFPLPLTFVAGKALVDHSETSLPLGAEILSINGTSMDTLVHKLQPLVPCDGFVAGSRRTNLAFEFAEVYAVAIGQPRSFEVVFQAHGSDEQKTAELTPVNGQSLVKLYESRHSHGKDDYPFAIEQLRPDTVLLTINSFEFDDYRRGDGAFRSFLRGSFAAIAHNSQIKNVVLDLRRNTGGYVNHEIRLHSYLVHKPFREMKSAEMKTLTIAHKELLDPEWFSRGLTRYMERRLSKEFDPTAEGVYVVDDEHNPPHVPRKHHFDGSLFILTSGRTHSAAASLCSMLDRRGPTIFVGQETGGVSSTFTAGNILKYRLPNSGVQLAVPIIQYHMLGRQQTPTAGRGVLPDHPVQTTQGDFISGQDRALEKVLSLLKEKPGS